MVVMLDRVKNTRKLLRQHIIASILNEFDDQCMELNREQRLTKYRKMMESPFRFFRGSAYLYYYDMTKIPFSFHTPEDKPTWIQGDLHMDNFGAFQNESGEIVYDVNDFDEGYIGSYLYDVLRMSISIALYAEAKGLTIEEQQDRITAYLNSYYKQLKRFKNEKDDPFTLSFTQDNTKGPVKKILKKLEKKQRHHFLDDITTVNEDGQRVFVWSEEIQPMLKEQRLELEHAMAQYLHSVDEENKKDGTFYHIKDIAMKHGSGTASIGLDRFYVLIEGGEADGEVDDIVLEVKEVRTPIPAYFLTYRQRFWNKYEHQGERVVATQKAMHHLEDPHLGYLSIGDRQFYVRERSPFKKKVKSEKIVTLEDFNLTLETMGKVTAKIHARADEHAEAELFSHHSEEEILTAIGDNFDVFCAQIVFTAIAYKTQVNHDYELFCSWVTQEF